MTGHGLRIVEETDLFMDKTNRIRALWLTEQQINYLRHAVSNDVCSSMSKSWKEAERLGRDVLDAIKRVRKEG
jgi:uncharacterized protein YoxC